MYVPDSSCLKPVLITVLHFQNTDVLKDTRWHPAKESAKEPTEEQRAPTPSEGVGHKITPLEQMAAFTQEDSVLPERK